MRIVVGIFVVDRSRVQEVGDLASSNDSRRSAFDDTGGTVAPTAQQVVLRGPSVRAIVGTGHPG
ncbi:hypothetical protein C3469_03085 [Mycobacterium kansasii]|nr:hypothetical protein C3B43_07860 [Mycobacterium kansasii]POY04639.1 hypothetical protein C3479_01180 [Mycobacterium kansasii]POY08223.1 hypothetical protein C3477_05005 [Mycobacterium kansasii]POY23997.1 hypothetical protein C3476_05860 [Mycobacterium kansasii]POY29434.1 hypothetical protein C3469_03085 [Mycobacterium kansasii]